MDVKMTNVFVYTGVATNVSLELYVASLGSINTENMVSNAIAAVTIIFNIHTNIFHCHT